MDVCNCDKKVHKYRPHVLVAVADHDQDPRLPLGSSRRSSVGHGVRVRWAALDRLAAIAAVIN